jgi:hypothetical protein
MKLLNLFNWVEGLVKFFTLYGGGDGDGGGGSTTSTSYSTNLPEYAQPFYEELLKQAGKQTFTTDSTGNVTGIKPFVPYTGERIAGFTPEQLAIQQKVAGLQTPEEFAQAGQGLSSLQTRGLSTAQTGLDRALGYAPGAISADQITAQQFGMPQAQAYMSPYQQQVTDIAVREAQKQGALQKQAGALGAIGRGTFGGARQSLMQAEQDRNLMQTIGDIRAKGQQGAYENAQKMFEADQARRQAAAQQNQAANLQAQQLTQQGQQYAAGLGKDVGLAGLSTALEGSKALGALGATEQQANLERLKAQSATVEEKQALQQQINDLKYQEFQEKQNYQRTLLEYYSNILRGNAGALGSTQVAYTPAPSMASQVGGLGLAGLGLYNLLGK